MNGAGKSTTLDIITGNLLADKGSVLVDGKHVKTTSPPRIAYCPQVDALALDLTGRETLQLLARLQALPDASGLASSLLNAIHMDGSADKQVQYYRWDC